MQGCHNSWAPLTCDSFPGPPCPDGLGCPEETVWAGGLSGQLRRLLLCAWAVNCHPECRQGETGQRSRVVVSIASCCLIKGSSCSARQPHILGPQSVGLRPGHLPQPLLVSQVHTGEQSCLRTWAKGGDVMSGSKAEARASSSGF